MRTVEIGGVKIGDEHPVTVAAEIGSFFGQDIGLAKEYIDFAKSVGVDFLKTEILHDLSILHDKSMPITYKTDDGDKTENYYDMLKRKQISLKDYEKLITYSIDKGLPVIASVYDIKGIDFLKAVGGAATKIASQNVTNLPLIEHCAKVGLPMVMDAGNSLLHELAASISWAEQNEIKGIVINHRPDGHPCPPEGHHMRILQTYSQTFDWPVGLACHYPSDEMIYLAIGMGARFIEKPLYHQRHRDDVDTTYVLYYDDYREMVRNVRNCSAALGQRFRTKQSEFGLACRACLVSSENIKKGEKLSISNLDFAWPMTGIHTALWNDVKGKSVKRDLAKGEVIQFGDIE